MTEKQTPQTFSLLECMILTTMMMMIVMMVMVIMMMMMMMMIYDSSNRTIVKSVAEVETPGTNCGRRTRTHAPTSSAR